MTAQNEYEHVPPAATASSIGAWLLQSIEDADPKYFYQSYAVKQIRSEFGEEWSYRNANGNWAIDKGVIREFNKLKYPNIRWDRSSFAWRRVSDEQLTIIDEKEALAKLRKEQGEALREQRMAEQAERKRDRGDVGP